MPTQDLYFEPLPLVWVVLLVILFNAVLFGLVSQQLYEYSLSGFNDSMCMKIFIGAQYAVTSFQSIVIWQFGWSFFVTDYGVAKNHGARTWQVPVSSACQCILVLSANIFLAGRIYALTRNRLRSVMIIALSIAAFGFGLALSILIWFGRLSPGGGLTLPQVVTTAFSHGLKVISGCLITYSLMRALLNSRTGIQKSECPVSYLIPRVVQTGLFAMIWAISGLVVFVAMPKACSLIDLTSGAIYTHVVFDTLKSRHRLRSQVSEPSQIPMSRIAQLPSRTLDGKGESDSPGAAHSNGSVVSMANMSLGSKTSLQPTVRGSGSGSRDNVSDVSEIECAQVGQPGAHYEFSYARFLREF